MAIPDDPKSPPKRESSPANGRAAPTPKRKRRKKAAAKPKAAKAAPAAAAPAAPARPELARPELASRLIDRTAPPGAPPPAKPPGPTGAPQDAAALAELIMSRSADDLETLSRNLAEATTRANNVFATAFHDQSRGGAAPYRADPFNVQGTLQEAWSALASQPETLREAHGELWRMYAKIWEDHAVRWAQGAVGVDKPAPDGRRDKRFKDPEWRNNPYFSLMRETYLATAAWIVNLVQQTEGLDEDTKRKAAFFVRQAVDAASPSNFLFTNPAALRATIATRGENLLRGFDNLSEDLKRGHGLLAITQVDRSAFEVGRNIATAPGKVVFRNDLIELIQYDPTTETVHEIPLLIFPPWINKFYILDLQEKNSFIRWLVDKGHTVLVAAWVNPDEKLAEETFEDYMRQGVFAGVEAALEATGARAVNAVGYCIGGTLLASTLAYMAKKRDQRIQSATFFAAQMDFELAGELKVFADEPAIKYLEARMEAKGGLLDAQAMADTFNALRSNDLVWNYVVDNYYLGHRPQPFDLLYWNSDQTRMPGALHRFYLRRFYHDNALSRGELTLLGEPVSLKDVKIPIYMQSSKEDHIAPAASVYRSAKLFGGPVHFMMAGSGHIAGVINHPSANKYQYWTNTKLPDTIEEWQAEAKERPGSWWPDWKDWLAKRSGVQVPARIPGEGGLKVLGDAPGEYVKVQSAL